MSKKEENKGKILELYNQGIETKEIAKRLNMAVATIYRYIKDLKEEGKIEKKDIKNRIEELYNSGIKIKEMAKALDVSIGTINRYAKELREEGKVQIRIQGRTSERSLKKEESKEKTLELYNQGIKIEEIAKKLNVSDSTVYIYVKELKEKGRVQERKSVSKGSAKKEEKKEKTLELYNQGIEIEEIAKSLNVTVVTINTYINELKEKGRVQIRKSVRNRSAKKEANKEKTLELYNQGIEIEEIAKRLDMAVVTIYRYIKELKEEGKIQTNANYSEKLNEKEILEEEKKIKKESMAIQRKVNKDNFTEKDYQSFVEYISHCKERLNKKQLKREDLAIIKKVVNITYKYNDIIFYAKACIHLGQIAEAKKAVNSARFSEDFSSEQKEKLNELSRKIIEAEKKKTAIIMLKNGRGVLEAAKSSGLSEIEVVRLNKKLLAKSRKGKSEEIVGSNR